MRRFLARAFAALAVAATSAHAANYTDHWWSKDESGRGLTLTHHNDKLFGVWYVYDTDRRPLWVVMPDGAFSADGKSYSGALYRTTGPAYRESPFLASRVTSTAVGTARLDFAADESSAMVTYTIAGTTSTKRVARQPFGAANLGFMA